MSAGSGVNYQYHDNNWSLDVAYFPWMEPENLRYAPDVGDYDRLKTLSIRLSISSIMKSGTGECAYCAGFSRRRLE